MAIRRRARIHIHLGTVDLPLRNLMDEETAHDIIDVDIGPDENVMQVDLEKMPRSPRYRRRMETEEEALKRATFLDTDGRDEARRLGVQFTGNTSPVPKMVNELVKTPPEYDTYRYRVVTLEHIDSHALEEGMPDAEIVDER